MGQVLALYNGNTYVYDNMEQLAVSLLGMEIVKTSTDGWEVILNAISAKGVAFYSKDWRKEEVKRDFLKTIHLKHKYKNLQYFSQML